MRDRARSRAVFTAVQPCGVSVSTRLPAKPDDLCFRESLFTSDLLPREIEH